MVYILVVQLTHDFYWMFWILPDKQDAFGGKDRDWLMTVFAHDPLSIKGVLCVWRELDG